MSRLPVPQSKGVPPKTGGIPRPSRSFKPLASSTMREGASGIQPPSRRPCPGAKEPPRESPKRESPKEKERSREKDEDKEKRKERKDPALKFPALSTFKPRPKDETELAKLRKKTARRNAPEGEDLKSIKQIMKNAKGQEITVHEFVGLVGPYTSDNGTALRTILATELSNFRTLARKIYDNMTQDISDVLTNEHIQLSNSSKERYAQYSDKMMRAIDEIYELCPDFDFERYYTDPAYLQELFPLPEEKIHDEDQEQALMRQEAYHRMMWLRSEGERLSAENKRLQRRFNELKKRQKDEMSRAATIDRQSEQKRQELEAQQDDLQDQLEDMNHSIEEALVEQERTLHEQEAAEGEDAAGAVGRGPPPSPRAKLRQPENWAAEAAAAIETVSTTEELVAQTSRLTIATSSTATGVVPKAFQPKKEKKRKKKRAITPPPQDGSPFHFSPAKTPPEYYIQQVEEFEGQEQQPPAHPPDETIIPSPPITPRRSPAREARRQLEYETERLATTTRTLDQIAAIDVLPQMGRRCRGPQDTWRGFQ